MAAFLIPVVVILVTLPKDMHYAMGCGQVPVLPPQVPTPTPGSFLIPPRNIELPPVRPTPAPDPSRMKTTTSHSPLLEVT